MRESLDVFNPYRHRFISVDPWEKVDITELIYITPTGYVPYDYRKSPANPVPDIRPEHACFSPASLEYLKQTAEQLFPEKSSQTRRLFLRRRSPVRRLLQQEAIEQLLTTKGFMVIEPEHLSFAEQVDIFRQAEVIVGQAGAALGNMVFAPKGCRVIALAAYSPFSNFHYFSNLAATLGHELCYVFGESKIRDGAHPAHGNIDINVNTISEALA